ncbi:translin-associated factor X-interacting protein 1 isoform X1 [Sander lucioperca]|uniref:Translin-associated factor X-interacting protein 1 N-terminal domain-containing protein n=3 Tax=Sander lucioperca TaxID=283035 RepID=A0A8D0AWR4_SANLU|nr:translin-associated factor X-interacting protein 1 isoform X1 [Sander lucioperca]
MSPHKDIKFPPLTPSQKQRLTYEHRLQNDTVQTSEEGQEGESAGAVQPAARKLCWTGSSYIYAGPGRKPQLLMHLESYLNKELHTISSHEPTFQELKLQVYRDVFGCFIKEFKTYQPLLSGIKKEYENTLAYLQDQIRELEPLRSHLRLVTEECDRKIQARWAEEQAEIGALKREKQQLQRHIEAMREKEKAMEAVVDCLQSQLSQQYLQYREERDARKLLIWKLNDLTRGSVKEEHPADDNIEAKDPVGLQLALKVCREDLTKAQVELNRMKAEYWDVVPRRNWDTLEQTHRQNLLQLKTLQGDFDQLKREYDTLLELHKSGSMQNKTQDPITVQMDESVSQGQSQTQSRNLKDPIDLDAPESSTLTVQEFRAALRTAFPLKSDQEIDELVASAQSEPDNSNDTISSQRLHSLLAESGVAALHPALE